MPTKFQMTKDISGYNGFGIPFGLDGEAALLTAGVAQSVVVPSAYPYYIAIFSYTPGSNIWVDGINAAVAPSGAVSATTAQLNPSARLVKAGQTISFITNDITSPAINIMFYVVNPYVN